jgi:nondiscriminating aspartyl-tRNA synthetase
MASQSGAEPPVAPAEVQALLDQVAAAGERVAAAKAALKAGMVSDADVKAEVDKLLALKAQVPAQWLPGAKKEEKKAPTEPKGESERDRKKREVREAREVAARATGAGALTESYGDLPLNQSCDEDRLRRVWTRVDQLGDALVGQSVLSRGYVHTVRALGTTTAFVVVRQGFASVQCVCTDKAMVKWCGTLTNESVVDVEGVLTKTPTPTKATQSSVEVQVSKLFIVNRASVSLAFQVTDCDHTLAEVDEMNARAAEDPKKNAPIVVGQELKLNYRHLSLRTPYQAAIMRVSSGVCHFFREYLNGQGFIEIQTPKLLGGQSEGGSEVFKTDYFGQPCCLAQSPQLHKQISAACAGLERVFEIGPVFRAENSNTNRHLCEFHGLDVEMAFNEHYHEVLDVFSDLFHYMFRSLETHYAKEISLVRQYIQVDDFVYVPPEATLKMPGVKTVGTRSKTLLLRFSDAIQMLRANGVTENEQGDLADMSTPVEKRLGALVKAKYGVDWYMLDKFPAEFRPFYTMPDAKDPRFSNSYDFFIRGQEILSGAQRVHDPAMLSAAVARKNIPVESLAFYINAFKDGALPHGGGGIGLERVVMLFLGLPNIRQACLFVRDPTRLTP